MAPKARMRQANKINESKVTKRGKIPTTLVSFIEKCFKFLVTKRKSSFHFP